MDIEYKIVNTIGRFELVEKNGIFEFTDFTILAVQMKEPLNDSLSIKVDDTLPNRFTVNVNSFEENSISVELRLLLINPWNLLMNEFELTVKKSNDHVDLILVCTWGGKNYITGNSSAERFAEDFINTPGTFSWTSYKQANQAIYEAIHYYPEMIGRYSDKIKLQNNELAALKGSITEYVDSFVTYHPWVSKLPFVNDFLNSLKDLGNN